MPYILSPEQKVVANELASNPSSSTKYFDIITAWQVVRNGCVKALREGKKIMLHIPDEHTAKTLTKLLSNSGLDDLTIHISTDLNIPEIDIIKLRSTLKVKKLEGYQGISYPRLF